MTAHKVKVIEKLGNMLVVEEIVCPRCGSKDIEILPTEPDPNPDVERIILLECKKCGKIFGRIAGMNIIIP